MNLVRLYSLYKILDPKAGYHLIYNGYHSIPPIKYYSFAGRHDDPKPILGGSGGWGSGFRV